jgi:hypothetical protein
MVGMTDFYARKVIDQLSGKASIGATAAIFAALFTAVGTDAGTGFTEVTGAGYARVATSAATWNSGGGSAPSSATNAAMIQFAQALADWTNAGASPVIAIGFFDALTGGNLQGWDYLIGTDWMPFTCSAASPGVITAPAHTISSGDPVVVTGEYGGVLPATGGSWASIMTAANVTTDTLTLGVNTTGSGSGMLKKIVKQLVPSGVQPTFNIGAMTFKQA